MFVVLYSFFYPTESDPDSDEQRQRHRQKGKVGGKLLFREREQVYISLVLSYKKYYIALTDTRNLKPVKI